MSPDVLDLFCLVFLCFIMTRQKCKNSFPGCSWCCSVFSSVPCVPNQKHENKCVKQIQTCSEQISKTSQTWKKFKTTITVVNKNKNKSPKCLEKCQHIRLWFVLMCIYIYIWEVWKILNACCTGKSCLGWRLGESYGIFREQRRPGGFGVMPSAFHLWTR